MTISIHKDLKLIWHIRNIDDYAFAEDKQLYNTKTRRKIRQILNCRSVGYYLHGKFYTLNKLRPMLYKKEETQLPF